MIFKLFIIMYIIKNILILSFLFFFSMNILSKETNSIYDFNFVDIDGNLVNLNKFKGKPILLVNTASKCGFTPQYEGLQDLFIDYRKTDLTIIATTSNSFNQEFVSNDEIKKICLANYKTGFVVSTPMKVKGEKSHPLYKWISLEYGKKPKWNFYKYLFDRNGNLIKSWNSMTKPNNKDIISEIEKLI